MDDISKSVWMIFPPKVHTGINSNCDQIAMSTFVCISSKLHHMHISSIWNLTYYSGILSDTEMSVVYGE